MKLDETFVEELRGFFGCRHVIPVGSGTAGLALLLEAAGARDKRVLLPALACPNVAVAALVAGAKPCLVDVDSATYNLSPAAVEAAIGPDVAAIVAIDSFGYPADIDSLREIAAPFGVPVIDDACQAYGGFANGRAIGAGGDAGVISFGYAKPVDLWGGGLVLTDSEALAASVETRMRELSFRLLPGLKNRVAVKLMLKDRYSRMVEWGRRLSLLEYQFPSREAGRLPARWRAFVSELESLRASVARAAGLIGKLPGVAPFDYEGDEWLPWRYSFKCKDEGRRATLERDLAGAGIRTTRLYRPVSDFLDVPAADELPAAHELARTTINIACRTTIAEIDLVTERLGSLARKAGNR